MPFKPAYPGEVPTLGWHVIEWLEYMLPTPDKGEYTPLRLTREQCDFILRLYELDPKSGKRLINRAVLGRSRGWGKALALETRVPTPRGWTTIGALNIGDQVFDENGYPCKVIAKSEVWTDTDCYEIEFSDKQKFVASGDHLWVLNKVGEGSEVTVDTRTIWATQHRSKRGDAAYRQDVRPPLQLPDADLFIDPYLLGVWLGDGNKDDGRITCPDEEVFDAFRAAGFTVTNQAKSSPYRRGIIDFAWRLEKIGVLNNKHIPHEYLWASEQQRWRLLQGLMDTDGHCDKDSAAMEFVTIDKRMADDFGTLLASLGIKYGRSDGRATLYGRDVSAKYRFHFHLQRDRPVFTVKRKLERMRPYSTHRTLFRRRVIKRVTRVTPVPTQCIQVDSPSHQFLVGERMVATHNSPIVGAIAIAEAFAPTLFSHWDENGRPVGKPWRAVRTPIVLLAATTQQQSYNAFGPIREMLSEDMNAPILQHYPGIEVQQTRVNLPDRGYIGVVTSSATSIKGARSTAVILDQDEAMNTSNGGHKLATVLTDNVTKTGGVLLSTPNAFIPGEDSVAERTYKAVQQIIEKDGEAGLKKRGFLFDMRSAPADLDLSRRSDLLYAIRYAYGDSSAHPDGCVIHDPPCPPGWVDVERVFARMHDPDASLVELQANWLNQYVASADSYIAKLEWDACYRPEEELRRGDIIALGFDGSRGRQDAKPDATALVAYRLSDGLIVPLHVEEVPDDRPDLWRDWTPNETAFDAAVADAFRYYRVAGVKADSAAGWGEWIARWEARYAKKLFRTGKGAGTAFAGNKPFSVWFASSPIKTEKMVEDFEQAVRNEDIKHNGSLLLTRHVLNGRRRVVKGRLVVQKEFNASPNKIDALVAAILARAAAVEAISAGATNKRVGRVGRL